VARPRTITDERVMVALAEVVGRLGPARLTLADVAQAAGVSTGMLVRRYGSKRDLLLAFSTQAGAFAATMRQRYEAAPDPLAGLFKAITATGPESTPEEFANHLAFLHLELADPEFRERLAAHAKGVRAELEHYLAEAVAAGLLDVPDIPALAAAVDSIRNGTQLTWAMHRQGTLAEALRKDLMTLLDPYRKVRTG
jgi:AcrR family transcriptional regulator